MQKPTIIMNNLFVQTNFHLYDSLVDMWLQLSKILFPTNSLIKIHLRGNRVFDVIMRNKS